MTSILEEGRKGMMKDLDDNDNYAVSNTSLVMPTNAHQVTSSSSPPRTNNNHNNMLLSPDARSLLRFIEDFSLSSSKNNNDDGGGSHDRYSVQEEEEEPRLDGGSNDDENEDDSRCQQQQSSEHNNSLQQPLPLPVSNRRPFGNKSNSNLNGLSSTTNTTKPIKKRLAFTSSTSAAAAACPPESTIGQDEEEVEEEESLQEDNNNGLTADARSAQSGDPSQLEGGAEKEVVEEIEMEMASQQHKNNTSLSAVQMAVQQWMAQQRQLVECEKRQVQEEVVSYLNVLEKQKEELENRQSKEIMLCETIQNHVHTEETFREIIDYQQKRIKQLEAQVEASEEKPRVRSASTNNTSPRERDRRGETTPAAISALSSPYDAATTTYNSIPSCSSLTSNNGCKNNSSTRVVCDSNSSDQRHCRRSRRHRQVLPDGTEVIRYGNGTSKEKLPNGAMVIRFVNGDVETRGSDNTTAYYYNKTGVTKYTQPDGTVVYHFQKQGQVEYHMKDGRKRIQYADGTVQELSADGKVIAGLVETPDCRYVSSSSSSSSSTITSPNSLVVEPSSSVPRNHRHYHHQGGETPNTTSYRDIL